MLCRNCSQPLTRKFLDLGHTPPSNAYLSEAQLRSPEVTYPLRLFVCSNCRLVQTEDYTSADDLFTPDYAYFSSTSKSWLAHAARYSEMVTTRLGLDETSFVIEIASNDGCNFVAAGIPCLGIEPTDATADAAEKLGIEVLREFLGEAMGKRLADEGRKADLICGNNVHAHVPDINDFTRGIAAALKPEGVVTLEFPHLLPMLELSEFDTVYHEHFSYLSFMVVDRIFRAAGLRLFDVEELPTHGHSLRVYGCLEGATRATEASVGALLERERAAGMDTDDFYAGFQDKANPVKNAFCEFLLDQKQARKTVVGYGAAAKGVTLLNYSGVKPDLLPAIFDAAASKQNKFLPGSHVPILPPERIGEHKPDYIVIFPWNLASEITTQLGELGACGTQFVVAVPELHIVACQ